MTSAPAGAASVAPPERVGRHDLTAAPSVWAGASRRFTFVDALRGVAALWVASYHFYGGVSSGRQVFPEPFHWLFRHGNCGVEVFFVISGFVIAYTIRNSRVTPRYFGNFMLRRSIRLEPPYWATIALAVGVTWLSNRIRNDRVAPLPSWPQLLAHVFYLQDLLGYGDIVEVFWTLCMEVQFYLTFIALAGVIQWAAGRLALKHHGRAWLYALGLLPLGLWSLAIQGELIASPNNALMLKFWYLFQLGVFAWWALEGTILRAHFWLFAAAITGVLAYRYHVESLVGLLTGLGLFLAGRLNRLGALSERPLQYFGRISYSLYLVHTVIGGPFAYYFPRRFCGPELTPTQALAFFIAAMVAAVIAAQLMYMLVERPSVQLSRRWKRQAV